MTLLRQEEEAKRLLLENKPEAAVAICRRLLRRCPDNASALHLLALAEYQRGRLRESLALMARVVGVQPAPLHILRDYATLLLLADRARESLNVCEKALQEDPEAVEWAKLRARSAMALGDLARAEQSWLEVSRLAPQTKIAPRALAHIYQAQARNEESVAQLRKLKDDPVARVAIADVLWEVGQADEALETFKAEARSGYNRKRLEETILYGKLFRQEETADSIKAAFERWAEEYAMAPRPLPPVRPSRGRKLRIGYLSGEFVSGPTYHFALPLIRDLDRSKFTVYCYHSRVGETDVRTAQYRAASDYWHDVSAMDDDQVFATIRRDRIDVLVDLSGHFSDNRLPVFGAKPAPVQFCFPIFPATTGLKQMDYLFTDVFLHPPGAAPQYTEAPWYLPSGAICFMAPEQTLPLSPLPALGNGHVTFGMFQRPFKLHLEAWDLYASILRRVEGSRLLVHFGSADLDNPASAICGMIAQQFEQRGVAPSRLTFVGRRMRPASMAIRKHVDISLDSYPFSGHTTTCESLWMGVPVVALAGDRHCSRVSYSLLARLGLIDWVAVTARDYEEIAVRKAAELEELQSLRRVLRRHVRERLSPQQLVREVGEAYDAAYRRYELGATL